MEEEQLSIFKDLEKNEKQKLIKKLNWQMTTGWVILGLFTAIAVLISLDAFTSGEHNIYSVLPGIIFITIFLLSFKWPYILFLVLGSTLGICIILALLLTIAENNVSKNIVELSVYFLIAIFIDYLIFRSAFAAKKDKALSKDIKKER